MMVGREETASQYATHGADPDAATPHARRGEKVLSVENVTMGGVVKNMSFSVFDGEVVGIFGSSARDAPKSRRSSAARANAISCAAE